MQAETLISLAQREEHSSAANRGKVALQPVRMEDVFCALCEFVRRRISSDRKEKEGRGEAAGIGLYRPSTSSPKVGKCCRLRVASTGRQQTEQQQQQPRSFPTRRRPPAVREQFFRAVAIIG